MESLILLLATPVVGTAIVYLVLLAVEAAQKHAHSRPIKIKHH
ncbi:hypothetical protein [Deinococcus cellulosilyticus]|nr:hypothetical protein [Deinococcus cellulosilyticus]